jgi:hypothetical protein
MLPLRLSKRAKFFRLQGVGWIAAAAAESTWAHWFIAVQACGRGKKF